MPPLTNKHSSSWAQPHVSASAAIWMEIEPTVRNLSWRWLRRAGLWIKTDDHDDLLCETRLRFLRSFNPERTSSQAAIYAYARRCCQSAARQIRATKDALSHAETAPHILDVISDSGAATAINLSERPSLGDLPGKLQRRLSWFAAHPARISPQVLSRLRKEISLSIQVQESARMQLPVQVNSAERLLFIDR